MRVNLGMILMISMMGKEVDDDAGCTPLLSHYTSEIPQINQQHTTQIEPKNGSFIKKTPHTFFTTLDGSNGSPADGVGPPCQLSCDR